MQIRLMIIYTVVVGTAAGLWGGMAGAAAEQQPKRADVETGPSRPLGQHENAGKQPPDSGGFTDIVTGMQFVAVDSGCFLMGDTFKDGENDEKPVHKVCVSQFAASRFDVTVGQFRRFTGATGYLSEAEKGGGCFVFNGTEWHKQAGSSWQNPGFQQNDHHPVVCVSWNDAQAFAAWMNTLSSRRYRLPTEAEWEYAARSGGKKERFAGFSDESQLFTYANFCDINCDASWKNTAQNDGYRGTSPSGNYKANGLGLYDMTGNVWQWVGDWYGEKFYSSSPKENPRGPRSGSDRVVRGGSWLNGPADVRAADRNRCTPDYRAYDMGFRLVSPM